MKKIIYVIGIGVMMMSCTTISPIAATNNEIGSKEGKSTTNCILGFGGISSGFVSNENYGVADAAKNGGITKIATVDLEVKTFIFFSKHTLIVTGK